MQRNNGVIKVNTLISDIRLGLSVIPLPAIFQKHLRMNTNKAIALYLVIVFVSFLFSVSVLFLP